MNNPFPNSYLPWLPVELQPIRNEIVRLLDGKDLKEIDVAYEIGRLVNEVRDDKAFYGGRGVAVLAESLGRARDTAYRCGKIARAWSKDELKGIVTRKSNAGEVITCSHLWVIASVPKEQRGYWLKQFVERSMTVRDLKAEIAVAKAASGKKRVSRDAKAGLNSMANTCVQYLNKSSEKWQSAVFECLQERHPITLDEETVELLERVIKWQRELKEVVEENLARLEEQERRVRKAQGPQVSVRREGVPYDDEEFEFVVSKVGRGEAGVEAGELVAG